MLQKPNCLATSITPTRSLPVKFHRTIVAGTLADVDHSPAVFAFLEVVKANLPSPHLPGALIPGE
ncbi:MAG: hypothetical protein ACKO4L_15450 [Nodosilinea sp.]